MSRSLGVDVAAAFSVRAGLPAVFGVLLMAAALWAAAEHPVAPGLFVLFLGCLALWVARRPSDLWFLLTALLLVASFTPWTCWWLVDESGLLVLAAMGAA